MNIILWAVALTYNIGAIFFLRRMFNHLRSTTKTMHKDVSRLKLDTHRVVNESADNATNIMAHHAEWKALHARNVEMYSSRLHYVTNECEKKGEALEERTKQVVVDMINATTTPIKMQIQELQEKLERLNEDILAANEKIGERDQVIDQRLTDLYAFIRQCKKGNSFLEEAIKTLPKPNGKPRGRPRKQ